MLPQEAIDEFKQIYLEEYGTKLTDQEATEKATNVFELIKFLMLDKPEEEVQ